MRGYRQSPEHIAARAAALTKPIPTEKRCPSCGLTKPSDAFGRRVNRHLLRGQCRDCELAKRRTYSRRRPDVVRRHNKLGSYRRRGLTEAEYETLLAAQGGVCAICRRPPKPGGRRLAVDHHHRTDERRGLLCDRCNIAIGMFGDDFAALTAALEYLAGFAHVGHSGEEPGEWR